MFHSKSLQERLATQSTPGVNAVLINQRQEGNPLLRYLRHIRWTFAKIIPDYCLGSGICFVFISLRYHMLNPKYLAIRIRELQDSFHLRVVLCQLDVEDVIASLCTVNKISAMGSCCLVCVWSPEEAARYIEAFKIYETKTPQSIMEKVDGDYGSQLTSALLAIRGLNKVDTAVLSTSFGTLKALICAEKEQLLSCAGIGPTKVKRMYDVLHAPLKRCC